MYPNTCYAGFYMPLKVGRFTVTGFKATVEDTTAASRVTLIDDKSLNSRDVFGKIHPTSYALQTGLIDEKGVADADAILECIFPTPVKIRHGISAVATTNVEAGTLKLYVE